jgi:hypothetical protein
VEDSKKTQTFGDFRELLPVSEEYMSIGFYPGNRSLQERWENNSLSADFIADYFKNFYVTKREGNGNKADAVDIENVRAAVKYIANELLENAMKFQASDTAVTAKIFLSLYDDELIFSIRHGIKKEQAIVLQRFIDKFLGNDPHELYFQTMRACAKEENAKHSGLGLLSMVCDYGVRLGWRLQSVPGNDTHLVLTTMACVNT